MGMADDLTGDDIFLGREGEHSEGGQLNLSEVCSGCQKGLVAILKGHIQ